jgi:hypothetical protein
MSQREGTLDTLIADFRDAVNNKGPRVPRQLHDGLHAMAVGFGSDEAALADFLERYRKERRPPGCPDSPDGKHHFTLDLEYDSSGETRNCEFCGALPGEDG